MDADIFQYASAGGSSQPITAAEQTAFLAMPLPSVITAADVSSFIARWNNTLAYNAEGIVNQGDLPAGMSNNFIAADVLEADVLAAQNALAMDQTEG